MAMSDPIGILLAHNHWAMRNVLDACGRLGEGEFHRRFEMGPGSLHDTAVHILGAMRVWTDVLAGRTPRPFPQGKHSVAGLLMMLDEAGAELNEEAGRRPLGEVVERVREGKAYTYSRAEVLAHVATHGMHHRAQCLNMLRQCGVSPLPESSVAEWSRRVDAAG